MFRVRELSEADETFKRMQNSGAFKTCNSCAPAPHHRQNWIMIYELNVDELCLCANAKIISTTVVSPTIV